MDYLEKRNELLDNLEEMIRLHRNCPPGDSEMIKNDVAEILITAKELKKVSYQYVEGTWKRR